MKITIFTSNRPRHLALISRLCEIADEVFAIQECNTVFPGKIADFFDKTPIMQEYFSKVLEAEDQIFGDLRFTPAKAKTLSIKMGDLNQLSLSSLDQALQSDLYVVMGASYIKGPLVEHLEKNKCYNIHMGVSPYYRGNSTNFWALYDRKPSYVGATIHLLTTGLDSGPILFHALPKPHTYEPFALGMAAVDAAQKALVDKIASHEIFELEPTIQDRSKELRYTRRVDFTDEIASNFLRSPMTPKAIEAALQSRNANEFIRPISI